MNIDFNYQNIKFAYNQVFNKKTLPNDPTSLPCIGILDVVKDSKFSQFHFWLDNNDLYLADDKQCLYKINLLQGSKEENVSNTILFNFLEQIRPFAGSYPLIDAIKMALKDQFVQKTNCYIENYSKIYGTPLGLFNIDEVLSLIPLSKNIVDLNDLCQGFSHHSYLFRELIANVLKKQEQDFLSKVPDFIKSDAQTMRYYLTGLLAERQLSYDSAIEQFDKTKNDFTSKSFDESFIILKLIAEIDLHAAIQNKLKDKKMHFEFPRKESWRFFIDEAKEFLGPYIFENEPFYAVSSMIGLTKILESKKPVNQETYLEFLKNLTSNPPILKGVNWLREGVEKADNASIFFNLKPSSNAGFSTENLKQDPIGKEDLFIRSLSRKEKESKKDEFLTDLDYWIKNATGFSFTNAWVSPVTSTSSRLIFNRIFLGREQMLNQANYKAERLMAYIWAARELEITHQLANANGRTSIQSLVKWIVDDPELPFYIPEDPNILDLQSPEKILRDVHSGMRRFMTLAGKNPDEILDVESLVDQAAVREKSWNEVHLRAELPIEVISKLVAEDKAFL